MAPFHPCLRNFRLASRVWTLMLASSSTLKLWRPRSRCVCHCLSDGDTKVQTSAVSVRTFTIIDRLHPWKQLRCKQEGSDKWLQSTYRVAPPTIRLSMDTTVTSTVSQARWLLLWLNNLGAKPQYRLRRPNKVDDASWRKLGTSLKDSLPSCQTNPDNQRSHMSCKSTSCK